VDARRTVGDQAQDRIAQVGDEQVARPWRQAIPLVAAMGHRHMLAGIGGVEGPAVDDLGAVGVDDREALTAAQADSRAGASL
jgi:hypothetical protein